MNLKDFKALTFDCYGTLIDWESGMLAGLRPLTDQLSVELSPDAILAAHGKPQRWSTMIFWQSCINVWQKSGGYQLRGTIV
jgi:FMN phosphatase YigB (HAD superfamily)